MNLAALVHGRVLKLAYVLIESLAAFRESVGLTHLASPREIFVEAEPQLLLAAVSAVGFRVMNAFWLFILN